MRSFQFHPAVQKWFEQTFGSPTEPQVEGWPAIQSGRHVSISAPTGSGKTLAAFLASLDALFRQGAISELPGETQVLYVSPLKALSNDIRKNLQEPLSGIRNLLKQSERREIDVRAEVRTGDTTAAQRQALIKKPPHILVTTPESLYLLLTSESGRRMLGPVRTVIVDEIHAVVDDRRGAHLALSLERLAALTKKPLQRIGLSATQKPIEEVARFLVGTQATDQNGNPDCAIIDIGHRRELDLSIELPKSALEAVMSNEIWEEVYGRLAELIDVDLVGSTTLKVTFFPPATAFVGNDVTSPSAIYLSFLYSASTSASSSANRSNICGLAFQMTWPRRFNDRIASPHRSNSRKIFATCSSSAGLISCCSHSTSTQNRNVRLMRNSIAGLSILLAFNSRKSGHHRLIAALVT